MGMNTLLANAAIELAVAALLGSFAGLCTAIAGWFNARARLLEHTIAIGQLQQQQNTLAATQQAMTAPQLPAGQPTIITLPAPAPPAAPADGAPSSSAAPGPP